MSHRIQRGQPTPGGEAPQMPAGATAMVMYDLPSDDPARFVARQWGRYLNDALAEGLIPEHRTRPDRWREAVRWWEDT